MARRNEHGLELSFKRYGKGRKGGRWYTRVGGKPVYFGTSAIGVSDRESYAAALEKYKKNKSEVPPGDAAKYWAGTAAWAAWARLGAPGTPSTQPLAPHGTVSALIDAFKVEQEKRVQGRRFVEGQQAAGVKIAEAKGENISPEWYAVMSVWLNRMKLRVGALPWDGSEQRAAVFLKAWRDDWEARLFASDCRAGTFNLAMAIARAMTQWAYDNHKLVSLPRNLKVLCAKYRLGSSAKAMPVTVVRKLWSQADDLEKAWLALALNCGFYAIDISELQANSIDHESGYLGPSAISFLKDT